MHWQDNDSSSGNGFVGIFPTYQIMLCGGHGARAHEKILKKLKMKQTFNAKDISTYQENYRALTKLKCRCPKQHYSGCGGMTDKLIRLSRSRVYRALCDAGHDPEKFKLRMTALHHHVRDIHSWEVKEDGITVVHGCDFHNLILCSCGNCEMGELTCEGKPYKTTHILSCRFHALLYKIECDWFDVL